MNKSKLLYDGMILLGIALVVYAGVKLNERYADLAASDRLYEELNKQYVSGPEQILAYVEEPASLSKEDGTHERGVSGGETSEDGTPEVEEIPWYCMIRVDFESLRERNSDVVGWIFFENEDISYPILYSGDNTKYFHRTLDGKSATAGSIFLDGDNTPDFEDSRVVIYGHNMKNLSMFGKLKFYRQENYYEDHQYFQILVEGIVYRYQIFSYFDVSETETEICRVDFASENAFSDFIKKLQKRSLKDTGIEVDSHDKVVTLITCYSTGRRTVVNAVRVDSYEIEAVEQGQMEEEIAQ